MLLDSNKLRQMREQRGWTQQQLAELCGVSVRTIQRIEKEGVASLESTSALASVYEIERHQLYAEQRTEQHKLGGKISWTSVLILLIGFFIGVIVGSLN